MHGISFVIPTYNSSALTVDCIESIYKLNDLKNIDYEIIVVDDFSSNFFFDDLKKKIKELNFPNITLLRNNKNMGPAYARNKGAKDSKFEYVFFLDSDTQILGGGITNFLSKIVDCDAVVGIYDFVPLNKGNLAIHKAYLNHFHSYRNKDYNFDDFAAACAGIKKEVFNTLKGFDETIKWGMDYECEEFGYRINKNGYKLIVSPDTIIRHHFPNGLKAIKIYYLRVSNWIEFYLNIKKSFDRTTATSPVVALACVSAFISTLLTVGIFLFNNIYLKYLLTVFLLFYLSIFLKFYIFVFKKNKKVFLNIFFTNFLISNIIAFSSLVGLLKYFKNKYIN